MTKRLIDIDDHLLAAAREVSGASTMKATVDVALRNLVDSELRRRHLRRLITGDGMDIGDADVMSEAWRR